MSYRITSDVPSMDIENPSICTQVLLFSEPIQTFGKETPPRSAPSEISPMRSGRVLTTLAHNRLIVFFNTLHRLSLAMSNHFYKQVSNQNVQ